MTRFLLLLLLAYVVFRVVRNLIRAVKTDGRPVASLNQEPGRVETPVRRVWEGEVEEARFRDL